MAPQQNPASSTGSLPYRSSGAPRFSMAPQAIPQHHHSSSLSYANQSQKPRQLAELNRQLAKLQANLADLENLMNVTAVQAEHIRSLGGLHGGLFMAAQRILGDKPCGAGSKEIREGTTAPSETEKCEAGEIDSGNVDA